MQKWQWISGSKVKNSFLQSNNIIFSHTHKKIYVQSQMNNFKTLLFNAIKWNILRISTCIRELPHITTYPGFLKGDGKYHKYIQK